MRLLLVLLLITGCGGGSSTETTIIHQEPDSIEKQYSDLNNSGDMDQQIQNTLDLFGLQSMLEKHKDGSISYYWIDYRNGRDLVSFEIEFEVDIDGVCTSKYQDVIIAYAD